MVISFHSEQLSEQAVADPATGEPLYRRLPLLAKGNELTPGGGSLEEQVNTSIYGAYPPPASDPPELISPPESVPLVLYRAMHPALRLLQMLGYIATEIRINPPAPGGVATLTRGTRPVTIDLTHMEAIPFDVSEPDFVDRPYGKLDLPGAGDEGNWGVFGACIVFRHDGHLSYAGQLLKDMEIIAEVAPDSTLRYGTYWQDKVGYIGINLSNHSQSTFQDFTTALQEQIEAFVDLYLDAFEISAQEHADTVSVIDPATMTVARPTGPTGLLVDPMNWSHLFRYGETRAKRRARMKVADEIGRLIWDHYGQSGALARELLRSEAFGDLIQPEPNPEAEPDDPPAEPYYQLVSLEERIVRAMTGVAEANGRPIETRKYRRRAKSLLRKWSSIAEADIRNMESTYSGQHDLPGVPSPAEYLAAPFTGFVQDAINRFLIGYKGLPHEGNFSLGGAGYGLRAQVLLPVEGLVSEFIRAWHVNRAQSLRSLRLLSGMLWDVRDALLGADALQSAIYGFGTPELNPAENPDDTFSAQINAAAGFRSALDYPAEVFDTLDHCKAARDKIDRLIQRGRAEARINDPLARAGDEGYTQIVLPEEIWDTWEAIGIAFAHADRFFFEAEGPDIFLILSPYMEPPKRFLAGFRDGLKLDEPDGWEEIYDLAGKWLKNSIIATAFPVVLMGGVVWGAAKKIWDVLSQIYDFIRDPQQFIDQITKAIEVIFETALNDLMYALGKGLGETAYNEVARLNKIDNPFHFVFEIGVLLGPIVLEIIVSWFIQAYVVVPILNRARGALTEIFFPVLRTMDGDGLLAATRLLPDGSARPNGTLPDPVDIADIPRVPYRSSDPLPAVLDDGTPIPVKPMERSLNGDIINDLSGLQPSSMNPEQLALYRPNELIPVDERQLVRDGLDALPDSARTRQLGPDEINADVWDADTQRMAETKMLDRRFELDDRLDRARNELVTRPPDQLPVMSTNPTRYFDADQLGDMQFTLYYLTHNPELMDYVNYGKIIRLFGNGPDALHIDDQMRVLAGMSKAQIGLADDLAFRQLLNRYATTGNWRLFHILGQDDVIISNAKWASATFPDGHLNDRIAQLVAEAVPNRTRLDELIDPLHHHLRGRIRRAYESNDLVRDRFARQQGTYATTINAVEQDVLDAVPAATRQAATDIFHAYGILGWTQRVMGRAGFISRPDRRMPSLPQIVEMWVRRNPARRTAADFDAQAAVSAGYNQMLRDSNLKTRVHAGHLIAHRHDGPTIGGNMIPMSENFNVVAYGRIERMTDWALRYYPDNVYVQVEVLGYNNSTALARALRYRAFVPENPLDPDSPPRLLINELLDADLLDPHGAGFER